MKQNYAAYIAGFGDVNGEHWLGLEKMHQLTKDEPMECEIDLVGCGTDNATSSYGTFQVRSSILRRASKDIVVIVTVNPQISPPSN